MLIFADAAALCNGTAGVGPLAGLSVT